MTTGKGFADVVFIPFVENMPAMIIKLKRNDCAESAISQIKEKNSLIHCSITPGIFFLLESITMRRKKLMSARLKSWKNNESKQ